MLVLFSSWIPGILENPLFFTFFYLFFKFSEVKVGFSHVGPVFLLDSRNFGKSTFFYLFFYLFSMFSEVKVDFSHVGHVFLLDSRNFGKSTFLKICFTFFLHFFHVF